MCRSGKRSNTPVKMSWLIVDGTVANTPARPPTALALASGRAPPYNVPPPFLTAASVALRCFWRALREITLMWMHTGIPSSAAAAQNGSSPRETPSPPDGQLLMATVLNPILAAY